MESSWLDIAIVIIFILGVIAAKKKKVIIELIDLIGVMCATFIALHFYSNLAIFINKKLFFSEEISGVVAFLVLGASIIIGFRFIREGWAVLFKTEIDSSLEKFLAMLIAAVRMYFLCGLIFLAFLISGDLSLERAARESISAKILLYTSSGFYETVCKNVVSKFFPDEKINGNVFAVVQKDIKNKPKK